MRRKKLDVVFDEKVNEIALEIAKEFSKDAKESGQDKKANKSEIIRCALNIGLAEIKKEMPKWKEEKGTMHTRLNIKNLRAMLGR